MPASEEIKENNIESLEPKKALKKKVLIKSKDKVKDLDLSNYGYRTQARIYAIMSLYAYEMNKGDMNLEEVLSFDYEDKNINDSIKQFAKELIEGTINNLERIDAIIEKYSKNWDIKRIQYVDKSILRMSIYSLIYLKEKISKPIIINEAVEIAKIFALDEYSPKRYVSFLCLRAFTELLPLKSYDFSTLADIFTTNRIQPGLNSFSPLFDRLTFTAIIGSGRKVHHPFLIFFLGDDFLVQFFSAELPLREKLVQQMIMEL